jgi:hypothetical protein
MTRLTFALFRFAGCEFIAAMAYLSTGAIIKMTALLL